MNSSFQITELLLPIIIFISVIAPIVILVKKAWVFMFNGIIQAAKKDPKKFETDVLDPSIANKSKIIKEITEIKKLTKAKSLGKVNKQQNFELTALSNDGGTHMYHATIRTEMQQNQLKYKIVSFERFM